MVIHIDFDGFDFSKLKRLSWAVAAVPGLSSKSNHCCRVPCKLLKGFVVDLVQAGHGSAD